MNIIKHNENNENINENKKHNENNENINGNKNTEIMKILMKIMKILMETMKRMRK